MMKRFFLMALAVPFLLIFAGNFPSKAAGNQALLLLGAMDEAAPVHLAADNRGQRAERRRPHREVIRRRPNRPKHRTQLAEQSIGRESNGVNGPLPNECPQDGPWPCPKIKEIIPEEVHEKGPFLNECPQDVGCTPDGKIVPSGPWWLPQPDFLKPRRRPRRRSHPERGSLSSP